MKLIVGLGNPGPGYARTRHNMGFMVTDRLAESLGATWKLEPKLKAEVAVAEHEGQKVLLAKPQTMMNLSGESVQRLMQYYKLTPTDVWVVFDDVDVPFGRLRIRHGGSSGHQGIRNIITHTGEGFWRLRVGISLNDRAIETSEQYVLKPFNPSEREQLPRMIESAAAVIESQLPADAPEETTFDL